jgi:hypothetical protein
MSDATDKLIEFCFDGILIPINIQEAEAAAFPTLGAG